MHPCLIWGRTSTLGHGAMERLERTADKVNVKVPGADMFRFVIRKK